MEKLKYALAILSAIIAMCLFSAGIAIQLFGLYEMAVDMFILAMIALLIAWAAGKYEEV